MADKQVSTAADFAERETLRLELPRLGPGGKQLSVLIGVVDPVELVRAMEGVPDLARDKGDPKQKSFAEAREALIANAGPTQRVVNLGCVEPQFYFGEPEEGKAPWKHVHGDNQAAIFKAIMDLSGFAEAKPGGDAAKAAEFRPVAE